MNRAARRCIGSCSGRCATAITENRLAADEALPPERDLAEEFGVSRIATHVRARARRKRIA